MLKAQLERAEDPKHIIDAYGAGGSRLSTRRTQQSFAPQLAPGDSPSGSSVNPIGATRDRRTNSRNADVANANPLLAQARSFRSLSSTTNALSVGRSKRVTSAGASSDAGISGVELVTNPIASRNSGGGSM